MKDQLIQEIKSLKERIKNSPSPLEKIVLESELYKVYQAFGKIMFDELHS